MGKELKQKAEEYATENYEQCIYDDVRGWENDFRARKEAYLAGATENGIQWHFMKDVNCYEDLPTNKDVLYVYEVNKGSFDNPTSEWEAGLFEQFEYDVMAFHVIKWCEIPQFNSEV